jgi:hypothetical protein
MNESILTNASLSLHFAPYIPMGYIIAFMVATALFIALSVFYFRRGILGRSLCAAGFLILLLNPSFLEEERAPVKDVVAVIIDKSQSQSFGDRAEATEKAAAWITGALAKKSANLDVRVFETGLLDGDNVAQSTNLFAPLETMMNDVRASRRAGVIMITDGQVHDAPQALERLSQYGPIHTLLSGDRNDKDRRMVIVEAPAYGIVGQQITIKYKIEQSGGIEARYADVITRMNDQPENRDYIPVDAVQSMTFTIEHAGQNIVDLNVAAAEGELTIVNNRVPLIINGVRDRLKVLLVSGQPHTGGRMWRDLLTSDPGVDLVHFTILREPHKLDATPQRELSLIAFPFRELFEVKLYDFDLIIFDRYRLNRILPQFYFSNIEKYVREGGALLEASGPSFAGENSLYTTDLKNILPAYPTGQIIQQGFTPSITEKGARHPVTKNLAWNNNSDPDKIWGQWLRQVAVQPLSGHVLMNGHAQNPLLILDRVGEGRVAQLASDHIYLWARGYDGGGPQIELLRRTAHWLMKEPELEENSLTVRNTGNRIHIERRSLTPADMDIDITAPDGSAQTLTLTPDDSGLLKTSIQATMPGVYSVSDGLQKRFTIIGTLNPPEYRAVITTDEIMTPIAKATGGSVKYISDVPQPDIRILREGQRYSGRGWLGLRQNNDFDVQSLKDTPWLPLWLYAFVMVALSCFCWWHESRSAKKAT